MKTNFMKRIIPGHFRAFTIWLLLVSIALTYFFTQDFSKVLGIILFVVGAFLGDQATHLAQNDHSAVPPTWVEKKLQRYRWAYTILGFILIVKGLYLVIH